MTSGSRKLAGFIALAYTSVIVYASLQPFEGWHLPPKEVLGFLAASWPRYVTAGDMILNVVAYLPLGAMLFTTLWTTLPTTGAFAIATLLGTLLSLALESAQMFLPMRVASNVDLLTNGCGAGIGALAAWLMVAPALANNPLLAMRRRTVRTDAIGDCGLIVVALWILIQFHQAPLTLGSGDLRDMLRIAPLFTHTPQAYFLVEAVVAALAILTIGLLVSLLLQPRQAPMPAIAVTLLLAASTKSIAAATLAQSSHWLQWLTPGVATGAGAGVVLLALLLRLTPAGRAASSVFLVLIFVFSVNLAPDNPYQSVPIFMLGPQPSHLVHFSYIVRALSQLWPLLMAVFVLVAAAHPPRTFR